MGPATHACVTRRAIVSRHNGAAPFVCPVMAKVVLSKSGPADHFWSPKLVRTDHLFVRQKWSCLAKNILYILVYFCSYFYTHSACKSKIMSYHLLHSMNSVHYTISADEW